MMEHSLWDLIHELAEDHEQRSAVLRRVDETVISVSYGELLRDMEKGARRASALPGSRIGIWGSSSYSWIIAAYACLLAGKHVILFDGAIGREDFQGLAAYADTEAFAVSAEFAKEAEEIFPGTPVYVFDEFMNAAEAPGCGAEGVSCLPPGGAEQDIIIFTSGTSAGAKGVVIPVHTLTEHLRMFRDALPGSPGESYFSPIPYFHIFGFLMSIEVFNRHGIFCISGGVRNLKEDLWTYRADNVSLVPSMIRFVLETSGFPPQTRTVVTGASACPEEYQRMLREKGITLYAMYGMSEAMGLVAISEAGGGLLRYRPVDGLEVAISDEGEVLVTLPCHFKEYYKKEAETLEILRGDTLMTGDLGELDESGCLRIVGRLGELIVLRNGEKLNAADLDRELSALPGIREAAVFGYEGCPVLAFVPDDDFEEERLDAALTGYNRGRPLDRKITRIWNYRVSLPATATGKIRRNQLAEEYRQLRTSGSGGQA